MYIITQNPESINEYIESLLYKRSGISADQQLYRDFDKEALYKALARKGETLKHLWQKYNAVDVIRVVRIVEIPTFLRFFCLC